MGASEEVNLGVTVFCIHYLIFRTDLWNRDLYFVDDNPETQERWTCWSRSHGQLGINRSRAPANLWTEVSDLCTVSLLSKLKTPPMSTLFQGLLHHRWIPVPFCFPSDCPIDEASGPWWYLQQAFVFTHLTLHGDSPFSSDVRSPGLGLHTERREQWLQQNVSGKSRFWACLPLIYSPWPHMKSCNPPIHPMMGGWVGGCWVGCMPSKL